MTSRATPVYKRAPSPCLRAALADGLLMPLRALGGRKVAGCELDVQLRVRDEVQVYCGLTRLIVARRKSNGDIVVGAAKSYVKQECSHELFRTWPYGRTDEREFESALSSYLDGVDVHSRWTSREGLVQAAWARVTEPWVPFDREGVLGYSSEGEAEEARMFEQVDRAHASVDELAKAGNWGKRPPRGSEVDQLAVDLAGRLVVIELKDASRSGVYYAPLQLLQYVWEWHSAFDAVRSSVQDLLDARVALGLTPPDVPRIGRRIRPVVGFGTDDRSPEVKGRYTEVLAVVNDHMPSDVDPMETWSLEPLGRVG